MYCFFLNVRSYTYRYTIKLMIYLFQDTFCDEIVRIIRFNQNNCRNRQEKELNITDCVVKFLEVSIFFFYSDVL